MSFSNDKESEKYLRQSARLLPRAYGHSLNKVEMSTNPFYALNEIFKFVVTSEY